MIINWIYLHVFYFINFRSIKSKIFIVSNADLCSINQKLPFFSNISRFLIIKRKQVNMKLIKLLLVALFIAYCCSAQKEVQNVNENTFAQQFVATPGYLQKPNSKLVDFYASQNSKDSYSSTIQNVKNLSKTFVEDRNYQAEENYLIFSGGLSGLFKILVDKFTQK